MLYTDFKQFSQSLVAVYTLMPNIFFWDQIGYFSPLAESQPLLHTWSLGVEEQFYLLFPLVLVTLFIRLPMRLHITLFILFLMSILTATLLWMSPVASESAFYLLPSRLWELMAGAALVIPPVSATRVKTRIADIASLTGLLGIVLAVMVFTPNHSNPGVYIAVTVVATAMLLHFTHPGSSVHRLLCSRVLVSIGLASYSIYLWPQPVFVAARIRFGEADGRIASTWAFIVLVICLGLLTWKFIEQPFRKSTLLSRRQVFGGAAGLSLFMLAIGLGGHLTDTMLPLKNLELSQRLEQAVGLSQTCDGLVGDSRCQTHQQPEVIVLGDSYAMQWVDALLESRPEVRMAQLTRGGCGPYFGVRTAQQPCERFRRQVSDWIGRSTSIRTALISSNLQRDLSIQMDGGRVSIGDAEVILLSHLGATFQYLRTRGIEPVFIRPPPVATFDVGACVAGARLFDTPTGDCNFSEFSDYGTSASQQRVMAALSAEIKVVDWWSEICTIDGCLAEVDGVFVFSDNRHLTKQGSALLGGRVALLK